VAEASFPAFHVTGPVHHYVRFPDWSVAVGATSDIQYLGTCEVQPRVQITYAKLPVMNDIAGRTLPAQKKDDGQTATIAALINRMSQDVLWNLRASELVKNAGRQGRFARGQLMYGIKTFELWQVFENYLDVDTRALYPDLPIGYYWPQVEWAVLEDAPGNSDQKVLCQWEATPMFTGLPAMVGTTSANQVVAGTREWLLFSQSDDLTTFPLDVRVPQ